MAGHAGPHSAERQEPVHHDSGRCGEFGPAALEGAEIRLVFKPRKDAIPEHVADRLTQVKDNYANMVEEAVSSERLNT